MFVDESGDPGLKIESGSSRYFVVAMVIFDDHEEADAADRRIGLLRRGMRIDPRFEFRFVMLSHAKHLPSDTPRLAAG